MKKELTIYNFRELLNLKDALVYTRKITNRIGEKNILVGTDIFTIKYSIKKGDVIGIFYNGKILRLQKEKINAILNTYGVKLDLEADETKYEEKEGYVDNTKEVITVDDLAFLPDVTLLKDEIIKNKNILVCVSSVNGSEIKYSFDKKTKEIIRIEIDGKDVEVSKKVIEDIKNKSLEVKEKVKEEETIVVHLSDISYLQEHSIFKKINGEENLQKGYSIIGKNIIKFVYNKETKEISDLVINNQSIPLTEKNLKNLNIAIDAIAKALKIKSNLYTLDDIVGLEGNAVIRRIDDKLSEGFAYYGDEIVIRFIYEKETKLLKELEINDKIVPINAHIIKYLNTNIAEFQESVTGSKKI